MNIDLRKTYDTVSLEFIQEAQLGHGFPISFIKLVMTCVTFPMLNIKVNGEGHEFLERKRGLRQGEFVKVPRVYKCITHLIFVDYLMIFCKNSLSSVSRIMKALSHFSKVMGFGVNMDKYSIFMVGVNDSTRE